MALTVPHITDYKPFYIQRTDENAVDLKDALSVVVKSHNYPMALTPKNVYANTWLDAHGDEEYIGTSGLYFQAFTFKLECVMFAYSSISEQQAIVDLRNGVRAFRSFLSQGFFKTYDVWTGFGFQNVRLSGFSMPSDDDYQVWNSMARIIFEVELKVNDPVTRMVLTESSGTYTISEG